MREREEALQQQLQAQEQQGEQDQGSHAGGPEQVAVEETPILSEASRKDEEEASSGRKRRRQVGTATESAVYSVFHH